MLQGYVGVLLDLRNPPFPPPRIAPFQAGQGNSSRVQRGIDDFLWNKKLRKKVTGTEKRLPSRGWIHIPPGEVRKTIFKMPFFGGYVSSLEGNLALCLDVPGRKLGSMVNGSMGYFT